MSHQYDNQMMEVGSYAEAFRKGFLNPLNSTAGTQLNEKPASIPTNNNPDPYYQSGANGNYSTMLAFLNDITNTPSNPASLWHVAAKLIHQRRTEKHLQRGDRACAADALTQEVQNVPEDVT